MIVAIIWDLEGVLLRTRDADIPTTIARRLNVPVDKMREALYSKFNDQVDLGIYTHDDLWINILETLHLPSDQKKELEEFFFHDFLIDKQVLEDVNQYHQTYKTALLTNYSDILRSMLATSWQVDGAFDEIIISSEIHMLKPHPEIYVHTLTRLGCHADQAIFIDDRVSNLEGAKKVGLHTVQFLNRQDMNRKIRKIIEPQS
jgi:HAD superfamily hydrolase (TIGR01509 family)